MATCKACGASAESPTAGCPSCGAARDGVPTPTGGNGGAVAGAALATANTPHAYPNYDVEGLPDARHDEMGAIYNTGKIKALKGAAISGPHTGGHRPPVLASEALREDLKPHEPGTHATRWTGAACGAAVVVLGLWALGTSTLGIVVMALGAVAICGSLLPLGYALKATLNVGVATILLAGSMVATVMSNSNAHPSLVVPVIVLATGLLFRSWHRASQHARMIVTAGIVLATAWLGWSDSIDALMAGGSRWQSWLPAAAHLALAPVLLVALLAFMGETTTGGCAAWAAAALVWYGAVSLIETLALAWTTGPSMQTLQRLQESDTTARLLSALAAPMVALALAQLLVVAASEPAETADQRPT